MVGGAINQQSQASQLPTTEEDEFSKRNTDCVYFLASPLTCKKGSECEYRHSDIARVNPRDCWYWLNGNCLNPKCGFRHPPLDGLLGGEDPTLVGPAVPQAQVKQGVACVFFQKGFCLKGHLCPFLHGPPNMAVQPTLPNPVTKPSKPASAGPEKCVQEQKFKQYEPVQKPIGPQPPQGKQVPKVQPRNGGVGGGGSGAMEKKVAPPPEEASWYKPASVILPPVMNEIPLSRLTNGVYETNHVSDNEGINGKDVEEFSREPTPGFDVLVDDEPDDSKYYPNEEQFGSSRSHEFDMVQTVDYDVDRDMYFEKHGFERNCYYRDESPNLIEKSDLRHQLLKQNFNNVGGLRSVISHEHPCDNRTDRISRQGRHHDRHNDRQLVSCHLSSRLRGRIKIPGRSTSPVYVNGSRVEREIHIGRQHRSRYSPERPPYVSSNHNRFRDRLKGRSNNDFNNERRSNHNSFRDRLKGRSNNDFNNERRDYRDYRGQQSDDGQTLGKRKYPRTESQQSEVNVSFEGPKRLSEILKRKRGSIISSVIKEDNHVSGNNTDNLKERTEVLFGNTVNDDNEKSTNGESSLDHEVSDVKKKVGSIDEDAMLDQELEAYVQRDGDYEYEQIDGVDYNLEDGEEYLEEEDDVTGKKESEVCY